MYLAPYRAAPTGKCFGKLEAAACWMKKGQVTVGYLMSLTTRLQPARAARPAQLEGVHCALGNEVQLNRVDTEQEPHISVTAFLAPDLLFTGPLLHCPLGV